MYYLLFDPPYIASLGFSGSDQIHCSNSSSIRPCCFNCCRNNQTVVASGTGSTSPKPKNLMNYSPSLSWYSSSSSLMLCCTVVAAQAFWTWLLHLWAFAQHYFFWPCHALPLKSDEIMTTAPSRLISSTGSSSFLTSGIAVQVPRLFFSPWRFNRSFCSPYTLISRATCSIFRGAQMLPDLNKLVLPIHS